MDEVDNSMKQKRVCSSAPFIVLAALMSAPVCVAQTAEPPESSELTLERIMSDPEWIGRGPVGPFWAFDSESIYYRQKRTGEEVYDLVHADLTGQFKEIIEDEKLSTVDASRGDFSSDRSRVVYALNGDIFIKTIKTGEVQQLTRTSETEFDPFFMVDEDEVAFRRGQVAMIRNLRTGLERLPAELLTAEDPAKKKTDDSYLVVQQERLFDVIRERKARLEAEEERDRARRNADPARVPTPWHLGDKQRITTMSLSPRGDWMLVALTPERADRGKPDSMPEWVTESGYVEPQRVRSKVGTGNETTQKVMLLDLRGHESYELDLKALPNISVDPLAELKAASEAKARAEHPTNEKVKTPVEKDEVGTGETEESGAVEESMPPVEESVVTEGDVSEAKKDEKAMNERKDKPRPVSLIRSEWSDDGASLAVMLRSVDNKDRWLARVNFETHELETIEQLHDEAWINWSFNEFGWLPGSHSLWFLSERDGYSHLYLDGPEGEPVQVTRGAYEVSDVTASRDGQTLYFTANKANPGVHEFYRVGVGGGEVVRLTFLDGGNSFRLAPDERQVLITHSDAITPDELYVQSLLPNAEARRLTNTVSKEFQSIEWAMPAFVTIPSSYSDQPIHARVYTPANSTSDDQPRPAVLFVHGAGYLQNAHQGWSNYFREFMFHTLLTRRGYVVLDMDYRASAGYGRDWRTAIYRRMGTPELEDFEDGIEWLVATKNVDPERIGVYGGSYGGFMTLMGLFKRPDLFACGAALRPVTDWAHYNHGYTSNILNIPRLDPEAYEHSSPIEFAAGLEDPLLICHGMVDDNVFFEDTVRLAQRLIELKKENWEVAMFPVEPHGFREPTSWLNEYRRILKLFEATLKP